MDFIICTDSSNCIFAHPHLQSIASGQKIIHLYYKPIMILDKLENAAIYSAISNNLQKGFEFLKNTNLSKLEAGRIDIDGNDIFALVSEYDAKKHEDCRLEAHQKYADIQYIVSGREAIGFATLNNQTITSEYNLEKDIVFFSGETNQLVLESGMFAVFFPQDIHRPCMQIDGPEKVKKVVIKLRL
ncbi:MAG: YhcH/YjgK/YiaL family protein [Bacteroidota bacterium]|nr:YhcH/YjgK/YiaL family protein [Bacteroidota bacterium]